MADLFTQPEDGLRNLLPVDGVVEYHGPILGPAEADHYLDHLLRDIDWRHDEAVIFGKRITTKRQVAWYADDAFSYTYSQTTKTALAWSPLLLDLKSIVETACRETFNSCLLNLYRDGSEGMAWHSDAEKDLVKHGTIGSMSFGAERKFALKHKQTKVTVSQMLEHGSLLTMKGTTQSHWLHSVPKTKKVLSPRVNLTFRKIRITE
ncbi:alpha-ketoglutarate-dependent dioxygenase AlkB [Aestuariibius sp. HNIBRBA575]|uniref:alpha-ketoglutarate-dependent dioxygenase AlkB family protein n=1 Tax=Aestuariibius sp. HNIBRBA575 TaxID=3233343 RepID=UPI0034A41E18